MTIQIENYTLLGCLVDFFNIPLDITNIFGVSVEIINGKMSLRYGYRLASGICCENEIAIDCLCVALKLNYESKLTFKYNDNFYNVVFTKDFAKVTYLF